MRQRFAKEVNAVLIISFLKLLILFLLPLTGDEAYFITWGHNPLAGYYDHPPMVGWMIYLMSFFSDSHVFYRLFAYATTLIVAYVIYLIANIHVKKEYAFLAALAFLASPIDVLLVMMTNDVPLLLFGSLGSLFLLYSLERAQWFRYSLLSGIFLGMAFLSKYFAVFLMLGLLIFALMHYRTKALKNIAIITIVILLFIAQNLYFNYNSCWNNILFNFFARTAQSSYNIKNMIVYFVIILYLLTPWGAYYLFKERLNFQKSTLLTFSGTILLFIFAVFFLVSFKKNVGLHWLLLFTPYLFLLFSFMSEQHLKKIITFNARFSYVHIALIMAVLLTPLSLFKEHKNYADAILFSQPQAICEAIDDKGIETLFAYGYSTAALLSYHCGRDVKMLYNTNKYGRLDDKLLDVRTLDKKDFSLIDKRNFNDHDIALFASTCKTITTTKLMAEDAAYNLVTCNAFDYDAYKTKILDIQKELFYNMPSWLPHGECYFLDRYYP